MPKVFGATGRHLADFSSMEAGWVAFRYIPFVVSPWVNAGDGSRVGRFTGNADFTYYWRVAGNTEV